MRAETRHQPTGCGIHPEARLPIAGEHCPQARRRRLSCGNVHTLGDVLLSLSQQNNDVTFRLYDWGHVDAKTGKPRQLQVDQAFALYRF